GHTRTTQLLADTYRQNSVISGPVLARALSGTVFGLDGVRVEVEADIADGLPGFHIVGLGDRALQEARERVKIAINNSGFQFPGRKVTINLAPAQLPKEGSGFDLAMEAAIVNAGEDRDLPGDAAGQPHAKRALEVAAAGAHHLLLVGPPGAGKTLLARALPGILPPLNRREAVEVTSIASCVGMLPAGAGLLELPPFRAPHHTISPAALIGGGAAAHRP